jgi:antitoxin FitA
MLIKRENDMATLTIRNLDESVKERLRIRAATMGHSMEEEARLILKKSVTFVTGAELWKSSRILFDGENGIKLDLPDRTHDRAPFDFDDNDSKS